MSFQDSACQLLGQIAGLTCSERTCAGSPVLRWGGWALQAWQTRQTRWAAISADGLVLSCLGVLVHYFTQVCQAADIIGNFYALVISAKVNRKQFTYEKMSPFMIRVLGDKIRSIPSTKTRFVCSGIQPALPWQHLRKKDIFTLNWTMKRILGKEKDKPPNRSDTCTATRYL